MRGHAVRIDVQIRGTLERFMFEELNFHKLAFLNSLVAQLSRGCCTTISKVSLVKFQGP